MDVRFEGNTSTGKDEWLTPPHIIKSLGEFDLDPCSPINRPWDTARNHYTINDDGLVMPWSGRVWCNINFNNFAEWKSDVQNADFLNQQQGNIFTQDHQGDADSCQHVKSVKNQLIKQDLLFDLNLNGVNINTTFYPTDCAHVQNVNLSSHLTRIIFLLMLVEKADLLHGAGIVLEKGQEKKCVKEGIILLQEIRFLMKKTDTENPSKESLRTESEMLSEIISVDQKISSGLKKIGLPVSFILKINAPIAEQNQNLLKIITYLYQLIRAQEQYHPILFPHASDATLQNVTICHPNGATQELLNLYKNISNTCLQMKITCNHRVFCNPPYGKHTALFLNRCADHGNCIALTFARTETKMFFETVWDKADAILFIKGRLSFYHVTGVKGDSAGAPSVLIAYGKNNADILRDCNIQGRFINLKAE